MIDVRASLSKELPLQVMDDTIGLAEDGLPYSVFRERAARSTHPAAAALVANRFLLLRDDHIQYDRFLSLVDEEGLENPFTRKVMYGIWFLRDGRLRSFITEVVAGSSGAWDFEAAVDKSTASFFRQFFADRTAAKVRSNVQFFLEEVGILDTAGPSVNLALDDGWLIEAVRANAFHGQAATERRAMMEDPIGFIIANGLHGLANATIGELRSFLVSPPDDDDEEIDDGGIGPVSPAAPRGFRTWDRAAPSASGSSRQYVPWNRVARERASQAHHALEQLLATSAQANGYEPLYNDNIDLFFETPHGWVLAEIKSCNRTNIHAQVRRGVSQLLEYGYVYSEQLSPRSVRTLILQLEPTGDKAWLVNYLAHMDILVAWNARRTERLETTLPVPGALAGIIHRV